MDFLPIETLKPRIQPIVNIEWKSKKISCSMLRLDEVDKHVSGNKLFKLHFFLQQATREQKGILTFGGAWSNHLAATASACKKLNISCQGIIRGERSKALSSTLQFCADEGMQLKFVDRTEYDNIKTGDTLIDESHVIIPEGGYSFTGTQGAALIRNFFIHENFTHVCCSIGTGTTFAGLLTDDRHKYVGFTAIKNMTDIAQRINYLSDNKQSLDYEIIYDYHFGGFAKYNIELIKFMNGFYEAHKIPLDFVYTGKMMFGISKMIIENYFPENCSILCLHTGGLQGNLSLPKNTLVY
ncbi:MAG: 1-aminocyclopropane-1-carboxylate deaminase [Ginsengibacter sp.]